MNTANLIFHCVIASKPSKNETNVFILLLILYCLSPQLEYLLYVGGIINIAGRSESAFALAVIILSVIGIVKSKQKKVLFFIVLAGAIYGLNVMSCLYKNPFPNNFIEAAKIGKNFYLVFLLAFLVYDRFLAKGDDNKLLDLVYLFASIISVVNISQYIDAKLLHFGYYDSVKSYTLEVFPTREAYIQTRRTVGYFFDLHGQYFLPLVAASSLLVEQRRKIIHPFLLGINILSVFLSQIRLAYAMIPVIFVFFLFSTERRKRIWYLITSIITIAVFAVVCPKVFIHYLNQISWGSGNAFWVILNHLVTVPIKLFTEHTATFFLGGAPYLRSIIYSEVYFWTLFFYIGFFGVVLYFAPIILFRKYSEWCKWLFPFVITVLSLLHYKVFNTGINLFGAAIPIAAIYKYFEIEQSVVDFDFVSR